MPVSSTQFLAARVQIAGLNIGPSPWSRKTAWKNLEAGGQVIAAGAGIRRCIATPAKKQS